MKNIMLVVCVLVLSAVQPVYAVESKAPEYCEKIIIQLEQALSGNVRGDFSNRVRIALEAHRRLNCPAEQLLSVLRIDRDRQ